LIPVPEDYTDVAMVTFVEGVLDALYPPPVEVNPAD